jgi:hypothetical protein
MQSAGSSPTGEITLELAKMLALVAPITMSSEQQEIWLRAAVDALQDIRAAEVRDVSAQIRRNVTRPSQIVPEIARLVAENRSRSSRINEIARLPEGPPPIKHVMERDRSKFTAEDWRELNRYLAAQGSKVRYSDDGERMAA